MTAPRPLTLLLVTRDHLARLDVPSDGPSRMESAPRPEEPSLAALVDAAGRLGGPLRSAVWVLSDEVYAQTLGLAAMAVRGLEGPQLDGMIAFEAQTLSGIPVADSVVAWRALPDRGRDKEFQVAQMTRGERDDVDEAVRRLGGRLLGVLHPAGLPARLSRESGEAREGAAARWRRIEYWHDAVAVIEGEGPGRPRTQVTRADPVHWIDERAESHPATEALVAVTAGDLSLGAVEEVRFADPDGLGRWLEAWASHLGGREPGVPVVGPLARPMPVEIRVAISAAVLLLVIGLCWLHHGSVSRRRDALIADAKAARAPLETLKKAQDEIARLEKDAQAKRDRIAAARADLAGLALSRRLPARLLAALAAEGPEGLAVEEIDVALDRTVIKGLCATPDRADLLARGLARALSAERCRVGSPVRSATDDGCYRFEIHVLPPPEGQVTGTPPGTAAPEERP